MNRPFRNPLSILGPLALSLLVALPLLTAPAWSAAAPQTAKLTAKLTEDQGADLKRVEAYLNSLTTMRAQFLQVAADGGISRGVFSLSRPGRMRIQFDPPQQNFIVADGRFVYFWDAEQQEQSNAPIGSTLADFLLRPDIRLSGDITVAAVSKADNLLEITVLQSKDPGLGRLTLVFEERPFALRQWRVLDAQGLTTEISLSAVETAVALPDSLFYFRDPTKQKERD
jgi:outer membrane lipoprotein-sorting protein